MYDSEDIIKGKKICREKYSIIHLFKFKNKQKYTGSQSREEKEVGNDWKGACWKELEIEGC